jgi:hypothetical protein
MAFRLSPRGWQPVAAITLASISLVVSAALGAIFLNTSLDAWTRISAAGPGDPADGILLMTGLGGVLLSLWLGLSVTLSALSELPGALGHTCRRLSGRIAPAAVRKVVAFILGTTLTAALIPGTAVASINHQAARGVVATAQHSRRTSSGVAEVTPDASFRFVSGPADNKDAAPPPGWSEERPGSTERPVSVPGDGSQQRPPAQQSPARQPRAASEPRPASGLRLTSTDARVVVLRGDTLWSIAAHHLGPAARPAEIEAEWPRWLAANREVIGDDANLILPGQLLRPPSSPRVES